MLLRTQNNWGLETDGSHRLEDTDGALELLVGDEGVEGKEGEEGTLQMGQFVLLNSTALGVVVLLADHVFGHFDGNCQSCKQQLVGAMPVKDVRADILGANKQGGSSDEAR